MGKKYQERRKKCPADVQSSTFSPPPPPSPSPSPVKEKNSKKYN